MGANPADGGDFTGPLSGVLTFADGQAEATITVTVVADREIEPNETFQVTLSNASGGMTLEVAEATAVIVNDDSPPRPVPTLGSEGDDVVVLTDAGTSYLAGGGADVVADFEVLSDRVQVVGSYSLSQAGADVLVDLGGGDSLTLLNVQLASLPAEWIFS